MSSIQTVVPDIRLNEMMKNTAKVMDKISIIRSMTHGEAAHNEAHIICLMAIDLAQPKYPSIGSVVAHEFGPRHNLPPYVCIPNQPNEFAGTGYLSSSFSGFSLGSDPASDGFQVRDLKLMGLMTAGLELDVKCLVLLMIILQAKKNQTHLML